VRQDHDIQARVGGQMKVLGWILPHLGVDSADVCLSLTCSSKTLLCSSQRICTLNFWCKCEYSIEISINW